MDGQEEGKAIRAETSRRYAAWVTDQMRRRGWDQSTLARRTGMSKQTVNMIVRGTASQPTAWQIAILARTFGVDPNEIFEASGLWERRRSPHTAYDDLLSAYRGLGGPARRALLQNMHTLREFQAAYETHEDHRDTEYASERSLILVQPPESTDAQEEEGPTDLTHYTEAELRERFNIAAFNHPAFPPDVLRKIREEAERRMRELGLDDGDGH